MQNNIGEARRSYAMTCENGKFSQEDAAAFFGVSLSTYQKWEQGNGKLNGEILARIADKYNCSVEYLLCRTDSPSFTEKRSQTITAEERELLALYRSMDPQGRARLMEQAEFLAARHPKNQATEMGA